MKKIAMILPVVFLLSSCASHLNKTQCETISWKSEGYRDAVIGKMPRNLSGAIEDCKQFNIDVDTKAYMMGWQAGAKEYCTPGRALGFGDGQAGKPLNVINGRIPVCNRAGIKLDLTQYKVGRNNGLKEFCTPQNGTNIALSGRPLPNVCPASLKANFLKGWKKGQKQYCSQTANAFALGKEGRAYPAVCPANLYVGFKSEYDRGATIGGQIRAGEDRIKTINDYVNSRVFEYHLESSVDGFYRLGDDHSPDAQAALNDVNNMVRERKAVERDVFNMKITR